MLLPLGLDVFAGSLHRRERARYRARPRGKSLRRVDRALGRRQDIEPEQTAGYLAYLRRQVSANNRLLQESGISQNDEITLLAVSSEAQGLGIGTVLLDAATSYVSAQGASTAYLYTDTDCTWRFYESHHFKRMAHYRAKWKEHLKGMPKESFLYGLDLTA